MKWKTSISNVNSGDEVIRDISLQTLALEHGFTAAIFLLLKGKLPTQEEAKVFDVLLTLGVDHGVGTVSTQNARVAASGKVSMPAAIASGLLTMGPLHGSATESSARFFTEHLSEDPTVLVKQCKEAKQRIPGFGHKVLTVDNRAQTLLRVAEEQNLAGEYVALAKAIEVAFNELSSKPLPLNIDGAYAAVLLDMGFSIDAIEGPFIVARTPGLVAHIVEEKTSGAGLRRLDENDIEYVKNDSGQGV